MSLIEIEKGDVIATKDGRRMRVLSVYKPDGRITRVDAVDDSDSSPMRRSIFSKDILRILEKGKKLSPQPEPIIPDGQIVKDKQPVSPELASDVDGRERHKTASAENREAHDLKNNKKKEPK